MSKTLLDLVQSVHNSLDLTRVNSVNDSYESEQVAILAKDVFEEISVNNDWAYRHDLSSLASSGDTSRPTHVLLEDEVQNVVQLNYDKRRASDNRARFQEIQYITPEAFLHKANQKNDDSDEVDIITDFSGVEFAIQNDRAPEYYTSFDDKWIVMDAYNSEIENTIQESKLQCFVKKLQDFTIEDSFVLPIPDYVYPHFLAEVKSMASIVLKQSMNDKFEQQSRRQRRWLYQRNHRAGTGYTFPNYGRKGKIKSKYPRKLPQ